MPLALVVYVAPELARSLARPRTRSECTVTAVDETWRAGLKDHLQRFKDNE